MRRLFALLLLSSVSLGVTVHARPIPNYRFEDVIAAKITCSRVWGSKLYVVNAWGDVEKRRFEGFKTCVFLRSQINLALAEAKQLHGYAVVRAKINPKDRITGIKGIRVERPAVAL